MFCDTSNENGVGSGWVWLYHPRIWPLILPCLSHLNTYLNRRAGKGPGGEWSRLESCYVIPSHSKERDEHKNWSGRSKWKRRWLKAYFTFFTSCLRWTLRNAWLRGKVWVTPVLFKGAILRLKWIAKKFSMGFAHILRICRKFYYFWYSCFCFCFFFF